MSKAYDVIGIGVCTVDVLMQVETSPGGEGVQKAVQSALEGGGPVATALVSLARLGARTAMLDAVGNDWRGDTIRRGLVREGVDAHNIWTHGGRTSSLASILVRKGDAARSIVYSPGTCPELTAENLPPGLAGATRILHTNGRHLGACLAVAGEARGRGARVSFDGGAHRYRENLDPLVALADICIVAREFAARATGTDDPHRAAAALRARGPDLVVITDGTAGSWVFPPGAEPIHQPAFLLDATVDTTGCGDAYHGAFLFGLLQGYDLRQTARFAAATASLNSRALGGRQALPARKEVEDLLANR